MPFLKIINETFPSDLFYTKTESDTQLSTLQNQISFALKCYSVAGDGTSYTVTIPNYDPTAKFVLLINTNNEQDCTLNINGAGALPIKLSATDSSFPADTIHIRFMYVLHFDSVNNVYIIDNMIPPVSLNLGIPARPEVFTVPDPVVNVFQLPFVPKFVTEALVLKSGSFIYIKEDGDYTLSGRTITINSPALSVGDQIKINYCI